MEYKKMLIGVAIAPMLLGGCQTLEGLKGDFSKFNPFQTSSAQAPQEEKVSTSKLEGINVPKKPENVRNLEASLDKEVVFSVGKELFSVKPENGFYNIRKVEGFEKDGNTPKTGELLCPSVLRGDSLVYAPFKGEVGVKGKKGRELCRDLRNSAITYFTKAD